LKLPNDRVFEVSDKDLDEMLEYRKGPNTFMLLSLLYPNLKFNQIKFHQDHIHPYSFFTDAKLKSSGISEESWENYKEKKDRLPNLQLLEGSENESKNKMPFKDWFENIGISERDKYKKDNFIPDGVEYVFAKFETFYSKRKEIISEELKKLLSAK